MTRAVFTFAVAAVALGVGGCGDRPGTGGVDAGPSCVVTSANKATTAAGVTDGLTMLPGGRLLTPAGRQVALGTSFPFGLAAFPDGQHVLVGDLAYGTERLRVIDLATAQIVSEAPVTSHFLGLAISSDGRRVYASDPDLDRIAVFDVSTTAQLTPRETWKCFGFPAGLALTADGKSLLVAAQGEDALVVFDVATGLERRRIPVGSHPYQVAAGRGPRAAEAYVSLWGGDGVAVVDPSPTTGQLLATVLTGKNPTGLAASSDGHYVYVANGDDDTVSKVDLDTRKVGFDISLLGPDGATALLGAVPSDVAVSPDGSRIYVAAAGSNAVLVAPTAAAHLPFVGALPVGWYPVSVALLPSGQVVVANAKGEGPGANLDARYIPKVMKGTVSIIDPPVSDALLQSGAVAVIANNANPLALQATVSCVAADAGGRPFPVPSSLPPPGSKGMTSSPIKHVLLIVRENKTYDALLGDLGRGNGDPSLVLFGEKITPNLHALARQYANLDNFYSNAEASVQGHAWTTAATANDFIEKSWFNLPGYRFDHRPQTDVVMFIGEPRHGTIFERLAREQIDFIVWGEIVGLNRDLGPHFDGNFPGLFYNLDVTDVTKAAYVIDRLKTQEYLPPFAYLALPNDHTYGTLPGKPKPEVMVADNDVATGQLIDAISRTKRWADTLVIIIEDDPQDGGDHVEAHRSICVLISPYARRGATVSAHFDYASMFRTIELILGVPPLNRTDASAAAMFEAFTDVPDLTPYAALPSQIPMDGINTAASPGAAESAAMDFSGPDRAAGLGAVLWQAMKGTPAPWASQPRKLDDDDD